MNVGLKTLENTGKEENYNNIQIEENDNGEINSEEGLPIVREIKGRFSTIRKCLK